MKVIFFIITLLSIFTVNLSSIEAGIGVTSGYSLTFFNNMDSVTQLELYRTTGCISTGVFFDLSYVRISCTHHLFQFSLSGIKSNGVVQQESGYTLNYVPSYFLFGLTLRYPFDLGSLFLVPFAGAYYTVFYVLDINNSDVAYSPLYDINDFGVTGGLSIDVKISHKVKFEMSLTFGYDLLPYPYSVTIPAGNFSNQFESSIDIGIFYLF